MSAGLLIEAYTMCVRKEILNTLCNLTQAKNLPTGEYTKRLPSTLYDDLTLSLKALYKRKGIDEKVEKLITQINLALIFFNKHRLEPDATYYLKVAHANCQSLIKH